MGSNTIIGSQAHFDANAGVDLIYRDLSGTGGLTFTIDAQGSGTVVSGSAGVVNDTFTFADFFMGSEDADTFNGSTAPREEFVGRAGDDDINGGTGYTRLQYGLEDGPFGIYANLQDGEIVDTFGFTDSVSGIGEVVGTDKVDVLIDSENGSTNFDGGDGDDVIFGGTGNNYLVGGAGNDMFFYSGGHDIIADFTIGSDGVNFTGLGLKPNELLVFLGAVSDDGSGNARVDFGAAGSLTFEGIDVETAQAFVSDPSNHPGALSRTQTILEAAPDDFNPRDIANETVFSTGINSVDNGAGQITFTNNASALFDGATVVATMFYEWIDLGGSPFRALTGTSYTIDGAAVYQTTELQVPLDGADGFLQAIADGRNGDFTKFGDLLFGSSVALQGHGKDSTTALNNYTEGALMFGGAGADDLSGTQGDDLIMGGEGDDELEGREGNDILIGIDGSNFMTGGEGVDTYFGGNRDKVSFQGESGGVDVDLAAGTAVIGAGDTAIHEGIYGVGSVRGSGHADTLRGNANSNQLEGFAGNDTLDGRDGLDAVRYARELGAGGMNGVNVNLEAGTATDAFGDTDTLISIEEFIGTAASDTVVGSNSGGYIEASHGHDVITIGTNGGTVDAGRGYDTIHYKGGHATIRNVQLGIDDIQVNDADLGLADGSVLAALSNSVEQDGNVVITFSPEHVLTLEGVTKADVLAAAAQDAENVPTVNVQHFEVAGQYVFNFEPAIWQVFFSLDSTLSPDETGITISSASTDRQLRVEVDGFRMNSNGSWEGTMESMTFKVLSTGDTLATYTGGEIPVFDFKKALDADMDSVFAGERPTALLAFYDQYSVNATGSAGSDYLSGTDKSDILRGLAGSDWILTNAGDDLVVPGEGFDQVVLVNYDVDPNTNELVAGITSDDGSKTIEIDLNGTAADIVGIVGFNGVVGNDANEDFLYLADVGGAPASHGIVQVTIDDAKLADAFNEDGTPDVTVFNTIGAEALLEGGADLFDGDTVELVLMEDGTDAALVRVSGTVDAPQLNVMAAFFGTTNLDGIEDNILFGTPTV